MKLKSIPHSESPSKKRRRGRNQESQNDDGQFLSNLIKDLRSKRVFSPNLVGRSVKKPCERIDQYNEGKGEKKDAVVNNDVSYAVPSTVDENRTGLNARVSGELRNIVDIVNTVDLNSNFCGSNGRAGISHNDPENDGFFGVSKQNGESEEEWVQKTPPDTEIVRFQELKGNDGNKVAAVMQTSDVEKLNGDINIKRDSRTEFNYETRLVLKPCFKRKLFRAPGSFSFKRLLPYLVDVAGGAMEEDQSSKLVYSLEKSPTSNLDDFCKEYCNGDSGICPQNFQSSTTESSHGIKPQSPRTITESLMLTDKKSSFKEPCSNSLINRFEKNFVPGSPSKDQESSDSYHDKGVQGPDVSKDNLIWESPDNKQIENGRIMEIDCPFPCEVQTRLCVDSKFLEKNGDLSITEPEIDQVHASQSHGEAAARIQSVKTSCSTSQKDFSAEICSGKLCNSDNQSDRVLVFSIDKDHLSQAQVMNVEENVGERMGCNLLGTYPGLSRAPNGCEKPRTNATDNKNKLNTRNKFVRDPRMQLKLFGNQSSFSYKRMLPFIKDIVEDNTINQSPSGGIDYPKLEEGKPMELHPRSENSSCQNFCMNDQSNVKQTTSHPGILMAISPTECSTSGNAGSVAPFHVTSELTNTSEKELWSKKVILDHELESWSHGAQLDLEIDPNISSPISTSEILIAKEDRTSPFCSSQDGKVLDPNGLELSTAHLEVSSPSQTPSFSLRKGILKKNPRGCRGLCPCLSCSSFRLHAERAFEFSSNLMLDAEEVASDLMKELSYTRNMLEIAAGWINDESGVRVNQMKEACSRASEAENLAKGRLGQMNHELDIHSRIPCSERPNVKFAAKVEEKVIEESASE